MKTSVSSALSVVVGLVLGAGIPPSVRSDEGMWLFNNPPRKLLQEKYQFTPSEKWLTHLQQSAVRFNSGGSGSLISAEGLVMTNHHVGADALQKISDADHDYLKSGFHARTRDEELKCVDLELNVLRSIEDVTARINAAIKPEMPSAEAQQARRAVMNTIEKESLDATGLRSDVVTLYQGGLYHLYRYKKYTDVRLVFAPEQAIAFFGGDPDNFEYPRYDLDICFFRIYEEGKPAKVEYFLNWSKAGAKPSELVFVAGHPGKTDRLNTLAHLKFLRNRGFPTSLNLLFRREVLLKTYGERSLENARRAQDDYFGIQNSRKSRLGGLAGLQDPSILDRKLAEERTARAAVQSNPKLVGSRGAWESVDQALRKWREIYEENLLFESAAAFNSELFDTARTLVRLAAERAKPNADRLREYRESNLESLEQRLFSTAPLYDDFEVVKLADSLSMLVEMRGADDPFVRQVLGGKSPPERAAELIKGTKLKDVELRRQVAKAGAAKDSGKGNQEPGDPMLALAELVDPRARTVRKTYEEQVEEPLRQAYAKISAARFTIGGADNYPDATFTLRLAFGTVKGYSEEGREVAPFTTLGGLFQHAKNHGSVAPFALPASWLKAEPRLDPATPFNFVSTADIIGGNSGSPVVNREGELVGIIFDGNIQSLVLDFVYTDTQARAVSVHSSAIIEALRKVYGAKELADELQPK